jgi:hypothetical protein
MTMSMDSIDSSVNQGFDRLQRYLLAMEVGDQVTPEDASEVTGLAEHICLAVFEGLARAGLMSPQQDGHFIRRSLDSLGS